MRKFILFAFSLLLFSSATLAQSGAETNLFANADKATEARLNPQLISMFPNPVKEKLVVDLGALTTRDVEVSVMNFIGQELITGTIPAGSAKITLQTGTLDSGVYFLKVKDGQHEVVRKFMK